MVIFGKPILAAAAMEARAEVEIPADAFGGRTANWGHGAGTGAVQR